MARKKWKRSEKKYLIENYADKTTDELCKHLDRDRKSVNRMIEKLRTEELIGYREKKTVDRAYRQRKRGEGQEDGGKRRRRRKGSLSYAEEVEEV